MCLDLFQIRLGELNRSENEDQISALTADGSLQVVPVSVEPIRTEEGFGRVWPHLHPGEGHFIARLQKSDEDQIRELPRRKGEEMPVAFRAFVEEAIVRAVGSRAKNGFEAQEQYGPIFGSSMTSIGG